MAAKGHHYMIQGVKVHFPCRAYPSQLSMMAKMIKGLEARQNCLLESPTGSGKSLALLCAALAWQEKFAESLREEEAHPQPQTNVCTCNCNSAEQKDIEDVFEATTSEIHFDDGDDDDFASTVSGKKVTRKLSARAAAKEARYRMSAVKSCDCSCHGEGSSKSGQNIGKPKIPKIYFGTRTHKQIAQIARELGKTEYRHTKMTILASREHTCIHKEVMKSKQKNEDCKAKLRGKGCRFYERSRQMTQRHVQEELTEAWDLEQFIGYCKQHNSCPYFSTRQMLEQAEIIFAPYNYLIDPAISDRMELNLKDHILILDEAHNIEDSCREAGSATFNQKDVKDAEMNMASLIQVNVKPEETTRLKKLLRQMEEFMHERGEALVARSGQDQPSKVWSGMEIIAVLKELYMDVNAFDTIKSDFLEVMNELNELAEKSTPAVVLSSTTVHVIGTLIWTLTFIYRNDNKYLSDYRLVLARRQVQADLDLTDAGGWLNTRRKQKSKMTFTYDLHFWCLNPAVAFSHVSDAVRSCIVTSGTLSPLASFQSELDTQFPIQLEASHVINKNQVWVGAIAQGPRGTSLLGSYQSTQTFQYQDDVGRLLLQICRTIPHGVLCFLPSYSLMDRLQMRWKDTGLWGDLEQCKHIVSEPRRGGKAAFDDIMQDYYTAIQNTADGAQGGITGAMFFAVCRGKVSEGLDFTDHNARCVVAIGIPFPNFKDEQVQLKKQYNNDYSSSRGLLSGSDWYEIQAYRALNQALGRCIRHRYDWGALILVDDRYGKNPRRYTKGLSKWVRGNVSFYQNFNTAQKSLEDFTTKMLQCPPALEAQRQQQRVPETPSPDGTILISSTPSTQQSFDGERQTPGAPGSLYATTTSPHAQQNLTLNSSQMSNYSMSSQAGGFVRSQTAADVTGKANYADSVIRGYLKCAPAKPSDDASTSTSLYYSLFSPPKPKFALWKDCNQSQSTPESVQCATDSEGFVTPPPMVSIIRSAASHQPEINPPVKVEDMDTSVIDFNPASTSTQIPDKISPDPASSFQFNPSSTSTQILSKLSSNPGASNPEDHFSGSQTINSSPPLFDDDNSEIVVPKINELKRSGSQFQKRNKRQRLSMHKRTCSDTTITTKKQSPPMTILMCEQCHSEICFSSTAVHLTAVHDVFISRLLHVDDSVVLYKCDYDKLVPDSLSPIKHNSHAVSNNDSHADADVLNSYYDSARGLCIQLLQCTVCSSTSSTDRGVTLGGVIRLAADGAHTDHRPGQVYLSSVHITKSSPG